MLKKKSTRDMVMSAGTRQKSISEEELYPEIRLSKASPIIQKDYEPAGPPSERRAAVNTGKDRIKKERKKSPVRAAQKSSAPVFKSRVFWGCTSLFIAFLLAFVAMPIIEKSNVERVSVIVAAQDIPEGMKIERTMLQIKEFCKSDLPSNALLSEDDAVGKYTEVKLLSGDMLTTAKVGETYHEDTYLYDLPDGKMAMSIELSDLAQSVSGKIRSGDVIRIYAVYNKKNNESVDVNDYSAYLVNELQYVEVLAVTNPNVQDIGGKVESNGNISGNGDTKDKKSIATVTLLVNNKQAEVLAGLNNNATLYAALVVRGDNVKKQAALATEDKYLEGEVLQ